MRKINVLKINPSSFVAGSIEVLGDVTNIFRGKFFMNEQGDTLPAYTDPAPAGYKLVPATTFDLIDNVKYAGRYTVYTPDSPSDTPPSQFDGTKTTIRVNEVIQNLGVTDPVDADTTGVLTNMSTYLLNVGGEVIIVPPKADFPNLPVELFGRGIDGWGEGYAQNFVSLASSFAGPTAPVNPFIGTQWLNTDDSVVRIWNGTSWVLLNGAAFGTTFRHTQGSPSTTWTINHGLGLEAPFIAFVQFFVDRGDGPKPIIPSDVTFVTANQLTVSFSNPEVGYALVRP